MYTHASIEKFKNYVKQQTVYLVTLKSCMDLIGSIEKEV